VTERGAFITLEGAEGVGKTTSLAAAQDCLRQLGVDVCLTREPGGTSLGETIREWILHGDHGALSAEVEALLMFAARAQHVDEIILPALTAGRWVLCDRFSDATFAYQGGGRGADRAFLQQLADGVQRGLQPDLTILLDAPVEVGLGRIAGRAHDHFEREQRDFFERVRASYLARAAAEPARFRVLDATQPQEAVIERIRRELIEFAERFRMGHSEAE